MESDNKNLIYLMIIYKTLVRSANEKTNPADKKNQQIKVAKKERTPETKLPASLETLLTESFQNVKEKPNLSGELLVDKNSRQESRIFKNFQF